SGHSALPRHGPAQRVNRHPLDGRALSSTRASRGNRARQVFGQEIPRGTLTTLPLPVTATVSVGFATADQAVTLTPPSSEATKTRVATRRRDTPSFSSVCLPATSELLDRRTHVPLDCRDDLAGQPVRALSPRG